MTSRRGRAPASGRRSGRCAEPAYCHDSRHIGSTPDPPARAIGRCGNQAKSPPPKKPSNFPGPTGGPAAIRLRAAGDMPNSPAYLTMSRASLRIIRDARKIEGLKVFRFPLDFLDQPGPAPKFDEAPRFDRRPNSLRHHMSRFPGLSVGSSSRMASARRSYSSTASTTTTIRAFQQHEPCPQFVRPRPQDRP